MSITPYLKKEYSRGIRELQYYFGDALLYL